MEIPSRTVVMCIMALTHETKWKPNRENVIYIHWSLVIRSLKLLSHLINTIVLSANPNINNNSVLCKNHQIQKFLMPNFIQNISYFVHTFLYFVVQLVFLSISKRKMNIYATELKIFFHSEQLKSTQLKTNIAFCFVEAKGRDVEKKKTPHSTFTYVYCSSMAMFSIYIIVRRMNGRELQVCHECSCQITDMIDKTIMSACDVLRGDSVRSIQYAINYMNNCFFFCCGELFGWTKKSRNCIALAFSFRLSNDKCCKLRRRWRRHSVVMVSTSQPWVLRSSCIWRKQNGCYSIVVCIDSMGWASQKKFIRIGPQFLFVYILVPLY